MKCTIAILPCYTIHLDIPSKTKVETVLQVASGDAKYKSLGMVSVICLSLVVIHLSLANLVELPNIEALLLLAIDDLTTQISSLMLANGHVSFQTDWEPRGAAGHVDAQFYL
jgi:hypothetical protein